jgi:UDP-N-acetylglucosamine 2-epimerase (non-hydrolysing)
MHILHVVGARPNFMKAAPVLRALGVYAEIRQSLVHTGQHYDAAMSDVFFQQLEMPQPDFNLGVGSGTHAQQTAGVMLAIEPVLLESKPDLVLVYGDVNSTVAAAMVCSKLGIRVGHVEAGLRSGDRTMPEEINRLLTDQLSDLLFTPSPDGDENLLREGIPKERIYRVGNVMIDTLVRLLPRAEEKFPVDLPSPYALVTLHRPSNVDDLPWLRELLATLADLSGQLHVVFPVHPRTRQRLHDLISDDLISDHLHSDGLSSDLGVQAGLNSRLRLLDPLPYLEFLGLQRHAAMVITDSGRDNFFGRSLYYRARKHRASGDDQPRNESAGGKGSRALAPGGHNYHATDFDRTHFSNPEAISGRQPSCAFMGWARSRTPRKNHCEFGATQELKTAEMLTASRWRRS